MVINYPDICWAIGRPHEANTKLIVDANAVLTGAVVLQGLQTIAGRHAQIVENPCPIQLLEFSTRHGLDVRKTPYALPLEQTLGIGALEGLDRHVLIVTQCVINVNHDQVKHGAGCYPVRRGEWGGNRAALQCPRLSAGDIGS